MKTRVSLPLRSILVFGLVIVLHTVVFAPGEVGAQAKTFELKYAGFMPKVDPQEANPEWWGKEVEKRTEGRVKVTFYHAETLGKMFDQPKMLKGGICDITQLPDVSPDFPLLHIFEAPFVVPTQAKAQEAFGALYYKGLLKEHLKDYKFLWWQAIAPIQMVLRNKKITRMEELKGLKIRGMPGLRTAFNEALGATGVAMPTTECFMALERGTLDGINTAVESAVSLKFNEVTKYWIWEPICTGGLMIAMNLKVWNSLPPDIQTIIEQLNAEAHYRFRELMQTPAESRALLRKLGWEVYELSPEERARWHKVAQQVVDKWVAEREAKGLPMRQVMEVVKRVSESFE